MGRRPVGQVSWTCIVKLMLHQAIAGHDFAIAGMMSSVSAVSSIAPFVFRLTYLRPTWLTGCTEHGVKLTRNTEVQVRHIMQRVAQTRKQSQLRGPSVRKA